MNVLRVRSRSDIWQHVDAYAYALANHEPRTVYENLYFTEVEQLEQRVIGPSEITSIKDDLKEALRFYLA